MFFVLIISFTIMLQDNNIKVKSLFGNFGTGKDFLMVTHAVDMILDKFDHEESAQGTKIKLIIDEG